MSPLASVQAELDAATWACEACEGPGAHGAGNDAWLCDPCAATATVDTWGNVLVEAAPVLGTVRA